MEICGRKWNIFEVLNQRRAIDFDTYENLHRKTRYFCKSRLERIWIGKSRKRKPSFSVGARYYEKDKNRAETSQFLLKDNYII